MSKTNSKSDVARRREQLERKQRQQNRTIRMVAGVLGVVALVVIALLVWQAVAENQEPETVSTAGSAGDSVAAKGELMTGERAAAVLEPAERNNLYDSFPATVIDEAASYEAVIVTDKGDIRLALFTQDAPKTVNNFVFLANEGYYDGVPFHRVLEDFMAQGGDPTGSGSGGPGYQFEDETDNGLTFDRAGLLAMANAGPGTNGSQFFITFAPTPHLDGAHTIFGEVIEGQEVLDALTRRDPTQANQPEGDIIERIEIYESKS